MFQVVVSTYQKNRIGIRRAMPWSFIVSRIITGVTQIVFPFFIYHYFLKGNLNAQYYQYTEGADYMTYVVLGSAINVLAVSTLRNVGRALITELHFRSSIFRNGCRDLRRFFHLHRLWSCSGMW